MKLFILSFFVTVTAFAQQSAEQKTEPKGGKAALQLVYYRIDFTQEQTDYLRTHSPELIFSVTPEGKAKLEKANDIDMPSVVDSLMNVNDRLPEFNPEIVNGQPQIGIYFLKITWPNYQFAARTSTSTKESLRQLNSQLVEIYYPVMRKLSDFEEITYRGSRFDMLVGFFGTTTSGNINKYLGNGWGTKFDFMAYGKNGWGGGFLSTITFGKPTRTDPSFPIGTQLRSSMLALFSGAFGKLFRETSAGQFSIQVEPSIGMTTASLSSESMLAWGFSPGITGIYMLPLGKGRMARQYFMPVSYKQYLSFHVSARKLMFNTKEASGDIIEFGVSWRLAQRSVMDYKLRGE